MQHVQRLKKRKNKELVTNSTERCFFSIYFTAPRVEWGKELIMSETFKEIKTQEELDAIIGERLKREKKTIEKQYEGYLSPEDVQKKYEGFLSAEEIEKKYKGFVSPEELKKQLDEKDLKIKGYEIDSVKTKIALKNNLPYEFAGRLNGTTEEEIQADAEGFLKIMGTGSPMSSTEPIGNNKEAVEAVAFKNMLSNLKGE